VPIKLIRDGQGDYITNQDIRVIMQLIWVGKEPKLKPIKSPEANHMQFKTWRLDKNPGIKDCKSSYGLKITVSYIQVKVC